MATYVDNALPCPFCGSNKIKQYAQHKAYTYNPRLNNYRLSCVTCHADSGNSITPEGALEKWNRRV